METKNKYNADNKIYIDGRAAIAVLVTVALLVMCLVPMFVGIALDAKDGGELVPSGGGAVAANKDDESENPPPLVSKKGAKTGISIPCATEAGTAISTVSSSKTDLSGDTDIKSAGAILVELAGNTSIAEKNADVRIYPASMTKVMTVLVACENAKDPNAVLTVTEEMVQYQQENDGSGLLGFKAGESITVEDALYLINYNSDTIACLLIAEYISGSEEEFVKLMNSKAQSLGLTGTHFENTTGLHHKDHYTTCREMAAIMACAMKNKSAKQIITSYEGYTVSIYASADDKEPSRTPSVYTRWFSGTNRLNNNNWAGNGSEIKIIGGKTGSETIPSYCFVTVGKHQESGNEYICVTVGRTDEAQNKISEKDSTSDTKKIYQKYATE